MEGKNWNEERKENIVMMKGRKNRNSVRKEKAVMIKENKKILKN